MSIKAMKEVMRRLYAAEEDQYDKLWGAVRTLTNLGLLEKRVFDEMVKEDEKLFDEAN